ncbi:RNA polymerase sigma factor [Luteolibacter algae]|uniref:RNA polymerase sigma factor n=1 Tax=Luteolibacter algae TaxID=454151 RepID=A0ABW5D7E5_9BACT
MSPSGDQQPIVNDLADHLFRHESGKMVSVLTGIYGLRNLQLAEDVVQEAMIRALRTWPTGGIPPNPNAWLLQTAKNLAIDHLRREKNFQSKQAQIAATIPDIHSPDIDPEKVHDDQLRLMFVCCHPLLPPETQSALALKTLCGFNPAEIAKAFLISEAAVAKRLSRARAKIQQENIPFEIPDTNLLPERLDGVLKILYLLFNEGYKASYGDTILRPELCEESARLATILSRHPAGDRPRTHALLAMIHLTAARFPSRMGTSGIPVQLKDQDRNSWDKKSIAKGLYHLDRSASGNELSEYHFLAGIASCHSLADSYENTNWRRILALYDGLNELLPSALVRLNRAIVISEIYGCEKALSEIEQSDIPVSLANYHLMHAVLGELEMQRKQSDNAARHFSRALELAETTPERLFLAKRLKECSSH